MKDIQLSLKDTYQEILRSFLTKRSESILYQAQQFSRTLLEQQISPEELVSIHYMILTDLDPELSQPVRDSFDLLLEIMVGYGLAYQEHQSLREKQKQLESEIEVAADMQRTLLPKEVPTIESLDIGVISIPASKMSGDYYHFIKDDNNCLGLAIADIIGKGIPAALCMSMIKYAMDSLPEQRMQPGALLENLNRVVEKNIDDSMFITMMYGFYDPRVHEFYYSGAGHEPGFYYDAKKDIFEDLQTKGLVLGVKEKHFFREYKKSVSQKDMIVLLSDGVTDSRIGREFIERRELAKMIHSFIHLSAQEIVENVYKELSQLQGFEIADDFTLLILRRDV